MTTVRMLKKSWYVPAATALLNSFRLGRKPSETIVLVMVVPTLAPMMMGTALSRVSEPDATNATVIDVVAVLLWMMAVISRPMNKAAKGLEVARMIVSAAV